MNSVMKKIVAFSMIGVLQVGLAIGTLEASPKQHESYSKQQRYEDDRHERKQAREDRDRKERIREERERHEREMQRYHHETERDWHERQEREREHHKELMRTIGGLAILYLILHDQ